MDYLIPEGIEGKKPKDGMQLNAYIKRIKEENKPHDYYVEYATKYLDSIKINCYVENKINLLTIEYNDPSNEKETTKKTIRLIIAKNPNKMGNFSEIKEILDSFFRNVNKFATRKSVKPANYVAALNKLGWKFTKEGLDFILTTKTDGVKQIRKTEFGESEFEDLTEEDIKQNKEIHLQQRELELIQMLENYLIDSYEKLSQNVSDDLKPYKEKVQRYAESKNSENSKSTDLLSCMFREMKPIEEPTQMNQLMQESFNHNMQTYIDLIPERLRDYETHMYLKKYMSIREESISERENGILPKDSKSKYQLAYLIRIMDKHKEKDAQKDRENLQTEADMLLSAENRKASGFAR